MEATPDRAANMTIRDSNEFGTRSTVGKSRCEIQEGDTSKIRSPAIGTRHPKRTAGTTSVTHTGTQTPNRTVIEGGSSA